LSNTTLSNLASLKFVLLKIPPVKSALGILIPLRFNPEKQGLERLTAVIAAAATSLFF
jgi:hypothetical protein